MSCEQHKEHDPVCRACIVGEGFFMSLDGPTQHGKVGLRYRSQEVILAEGPREQMEELYRKYEVMVPEYEWDSPEDRRDVLRHRDEVFARLWQQFEPAPDPDRSDGRQKKLLVNGDRWRLELEYKQPGHSFLIVYIDGVQQGRVPIGNVLEPLARFDPEFAGERERLIQQLRGEVGDWKSQVYDQTSVRIELQKTQEDLDAMTRSRDQALRDITAVALERDGALARLEERESAVAAVAAPAAPAEDLELKARFNVLVKGARAHLRRCQRCKGMGCLANGVDVMPCPECALFRELLGMIERS